jgi:hypothetical protein
MKKMLQVEEAVQMVAALFGLWLIDIELSWWIWVLLFLIPDVSIIAYAINNKAGAIVYNLFHHKAVAVVFLTSGILLVNVLLQASALLLFAHISFDRIFGYGLKYFDSFKHTHLGLIGTTTEFIEPVKH